MTNWSYKYLEMLNLKFLQKNMVSTDIYYIFKAVKCLDLGIILIN